MLFTEEESDTRAGLGANARSFSNEMPSITSLDAFESRISVNSSAMRKSPAIVDAKGHDKIKPHQDGLNEMG